MHSNTENTNRPRISRWGYAAVLFALVALVCVYPTGAANGPKPRGTWVAGDFHQHTTYTDGSNSFKTVMYKNNQFGLDWWANSEHGGRFATDARGPLTIAGPFDVNGGYAWTDPTHYPINPIIASDGVRMWRWQSLRDFSMTDLLAARATYRKVIFQSLEWNVPGHEHCSAGIIANQFSAHPNANAIAEFEYRFDGSDGDTAGGASQGWLGKNTLNNHAKAVEAVQWMQENYPLTSYAVFSHVERKGPGDPTYVGTGSRGYNISDFRDFNNAAPYVCFGFESMPGHQKESGRGGYGGGAIGGGTFGGTGAYSAQVGGLWDALLGEGRNWWLFASSDFHSTDGDFWPGEYQKTHTFVEDERNPQAILDGLRSGNSFVVEGDLINALDFHLQYQDDTATMGETLPVQLKKNEKQNVKITIRFRSPEKNNNGDSVAVDHVDLIAGDVTGIVPPESPYYNYAENPSAHVVETFFMRGCALDDDGYCVIQYHMNVDHDMYFRLRGTNLKRNTPNETDEYGNPLSDSLMGPNTAQKAYQDLWFYSNPVFVAVYR